MSLEVSIKGRTFIIEINEEAMNYILGILEPIAQNDQTLDAHMFAFDEAYLAPGEEETDLLLDVGASASV